MNNSAELYTQELIRRLDPSQADRFSDTQRNHVLQVLRTICENDIYETAQTILEFGYMQKSSMADVEAYIDEEFSKDLDLIESAILALQERSNQSITSDLDLFATYLTHKYTELDEQRLAEQQAFKERYTPDRIVAMRQEVDALASVIADDFHLNNEALTRAVMEKMVERRLEMSAMELRPDKAPLD